MSQQPEDFQRLRGVVWKLFALVKLQNLYEKLWNPINYAIIGGFGVAINYLVWVLLGGSLPWYIANILAIFCAWSWNWSQSVGPFSYLWGFSKRKES